MNLSEEAWRMLLLIWAALIAAAIPLAALTPVRRRRGEPVKPMWVKYAAWFLIAPVVTIPMALGRVWMQVTFLLLSLYAFEEYSRAVGLWKERGHMWLARVGVLLAYVPVFLDWYGLFTAMAAYIILLVFVFPIMRDKYEGMIQRTCLTILGVIYCGWFLAHLAFLMNVPAGRELVLVFLFALAVNDGGAYLVGSCIGRRPLAPNLSPGKTVAGALGAIALTIGAMFAARFALCGISVTHTILLGFLLSVGGTCGDLAMAMIKRDVKIEDTGSLIPGHGGLLDRLDSVLFTAPIFFHFMNYFYDVFEQVP